MHFHLGCLFCFSSFFVVHLTFRLIFALFCLLLVLYSFTVVWFLLLHYVVYLLENLIQKFQLLKKITLNVLSSCFSLFDQRVSDLNLNTFYWHVLLELLLFRQHFTMQEKHDYIKVRHAQVSYLHWNETFQKHKEQHAEQKKKTVWCILKTLDIELWRKVLLSLQGGDQLLTAEHRGGGCVWAACWMEMTEPGQVWVKKTSP